MEQSPPREANRFLACREIPRILWNPKVHYRVTKPPPPLPLLSPIDPVHAPTFHFLKFHLHIILPSTPGSSKGSLSLKFPHLNPVYTSTLPHSCYMSHPTHHSRFYHPNNIGWGVKINMGTLNINFSFHIPIWRRILTEACWYLQATAAADYNCCGT